MNDGSRRSLNMPQCWKQFAERVGNPGFPCEEIDDAFVQALEHDWDADVPSRLLSRVRDILESLQEALFIEQKIERLEALRPMVVGRPLANLLIDRAVLMVELGKTCTDATLMAVIAATLGDWSRRRFHQIEEHRCRQPGCRRAQSVRVPMEKIAAGSDLEGLARRLLDPDCRPAPQALSKQTGLDDGVPL